MSVVSRNTPGLESPLAGNQTSVATPTTFKRNVLHKFRSFNYLFTLSACPPDALNNRENIVRYSEQFIIAKSSGKKVNQLKSRTNSASSDSIEDISREFETINLVESFNNKSPGRFDLFLNNVEIETLMSFNETTNLAMATKVRFEVFESMSINGFIEALQVASQAAGNYTYIDSPFILKVEFLGYPDAEQGASDKVENAGDQATRYIVINITKVEVELNETGTRYRCQAVAHNEMGYGDHNSLKEPIQMRGSTVYDILKNLEESLNDASKASLIAEATKTDNEEASLYDEYEIVFPTPNWTDGSFDYNKPWDKLKNAVMVEVTSNPAVFSFPSPGEVESAYNPGAAGAGRGFINPTFDPNVVIDTREQNKYQFEANKVSVTFPKGAKIHDIIAAVVRDSKFGRDIIDDIKKNPKKIVDDHMIEFIHVAIEVEIKAKRSARYQRPIYKYRYVVLPYKMHYSRIPLFQNQMDAVQQANLQNKYIIRKYEYLYTGKNVDVRRFNLTFNHLFYQAYPRLMGNAYFGRPNDAENAENNEGVQLKNPSGTPTQGEINSGNVTRNTPDQSAAETARLSRQAGNPVALDIPQSARHSDPRRASITGVGGNANIPTVDPYDSLLKNMHQAILDNTGMIRCEIEILGDPYFFVTGGMGNYRPKLVNDAITENGEAPYQTNEVIVQLEFRNPEDIDPATGFAKFNSDRIPFGGCFRVTKVVTKFSDGMFTQVLNLIRVPGQAINNAAPENAPGKPVKNTRVNGTEPTNSQQYAVFDVVPLSEINIPSDVA